MMTEYCIICGVKNHLVSCLQCGATICIVHTRRGGLCGLCSSAKALAKAFKIECTYGARYLDSKGNLRLVNVIKNIGADIIGNEDTHG
jgi:hypothetical protein